MKVKILFSLMVLSCFTIPAFGLSDFEGLTLGDESYWNGSDGSGGFNDGGVFFKNSYNSSWSCYSGWTYSNVTDNATAGYGNQYSSYPGSGYNSSNYGVFYADGFLVPALDISDAADDGKFGAYITNTTYAALSMLQGDDFAKRFGYGRWDPENDIWSNPEGTDEDWLLLTIIGKNSAGDVSGTVDFYLADYRFADNGDDYVVSNWTWVDFSGLGNASTIDFILSSSDTGVNGMNTPSYFAMDNLSVPEPATLALICFGNRYFLAI